MQKFDVFDSRQTLTAFVVCKDVRGRKLSHLLTGQFSEVFWMASESDFSYFQSGNTDGKAIPSRKTPKKVDAIFFHSSDARLLQLITIDASKIFEFNSPGTPTEKSDFLCILRPTAPSFCIQSEDIREIAQYLKGERQTLPSMCLPTLTLEASPALWLLCQSFLASKERKKVAEACADWWLRGLGFKEDGVVSAEKTSKFHQRLQNEWLQGKNRQASLEAINKLVCAFTLSESKHISSSTFRELVEIAVLDLAEQFRFKSFEDLPRATPSSSLQYALWAGPDTLSSAAATSLSNLLGIPAQGFSSELEVSFSSLNTLLVVTKTTIGRVPQLRLKGFRGPVVVVSTEPFSVLKQHHRVLRFGQGSHATFGPPWDLANLLLAVNSLVPIEPENLVMLQAELRKAQNVYQQKLMPCLEKLKTPGKALNKDIAQLQELIGRLRVTTPVACHELVEISKEKAPLQWHLQQSVNELSQPDHYEYGLQRLNDAFQAWHEKVSGTGEFFSLV